VSKMDKTVMYIRKNRESKKVTIIFPYPSENDMPVMLNILNLFKVEDAPIELDCSHYSKKFLDAIKNFSCEIFTETKEFKRLFSRKHKFVDFLHAKSTWNELSEIFISAHKFEECINIDCEAAKISIVTNDNEGTIIHCDIDKFNENKERIYRIVRV